MWWVDGSQGYSARGYGGHVLAVYPELDLVMVIRADTYHDRFVSNRAIARLFELVKRAGGGERSVAPRLVPLSSSQPRVAPSFALSPEELARYTGELTVDSDRTVTIGSSDGMLTIDFGLGLYRLLPESETRFHLEDSEDPVLFDLDADGRVIGVWSEPLAYLEAADAVKMNAPEVAVARVAAAAERFPGSARLHYNLARALSGTGKPDEAVDQLLVALRIDPGYRAASSLLRRLRFRRYGWIVGSMGLLVVAGAWVGVGRLRRAGSR
jgi:hypothetical protein